MYVIFRFDEVLQKRISGDSVYSSELQSLNNELEILNSEREAIRNDMEDLRKEKEEWKADEEGFAVSLISYQFLLIEHVSKENT